MIYISIEVQPQTC